MEFKGLASCPSIVVTPCYFPMCLSMQYDMYAWLSLLSDNHAGCVLIFLSRNKWKSTFWCLLPSTKEKPGA